MEEPYSDQPIDTTTTTVDSTPDHPNPTAVNNSNSKKKKKKKNAIVIEPIHQSTSSSSSNSQRIGRVLNKRRNHRILLGSNRRVENDVDAVAFPVGMSIAAVLSQVLERKDTLGEQLSVDQLSMIGEKIGASKGEAHHKWWGKTSPYQNCTFFSFECGLLCTLAVRESLANVFGSNKFEGFVSNFEKSFKSTLGTLTLINDTSIRKQKGSSGPSSIESNTSHVFTHMLPKDEADSMGHGMPNYYSESNIPTVGNWDHFSSLSENQENIHTGSSNLELALNSEKNQQLGLVNSNRDEYANNSMLCTYQKSVKEQTRANNLKSFEISLQLKNLRLKETKLALDSESNFLERFKLSMGFSKASFKTDKFKNQVEETRHAELLRKCLDCLVAGLFIMSMSLGYGTYVHSYNRIVEATAFCAPSQESKSWWIPKPMSTFNSGIQTLGCQIQALTRMLFGILMILIIAYLLLQRSSTARQGMPITFILLILGVACGFAGKLCVDTLGGSGYLWLIYWEALCILHFFSNVCTSLLFIILHGPVTEKCNSVFPYWIRRILFYAIVLLVLPMLCGLMPFASPDEWKDHVVVLFTDFMETSD